ncbi:MAG: hypothetical protein WBQ21_10510, partial [Solirubrobacteraceae bacterium]
AVVVVGVDTVRLLPRELPLSVQVADSRPPCRLSRAVTAQSTAATATRRARAAAEDVAANQLVHQFHFREGRVMAALHANFDGSNARRQNSRNPIRYS